MAEWDKTALPVPIPEEDTRCGFFGWYPKWLQLLASKKAYVVVFGLIGMGHFAITSYLTGTLTTIEKRFKIPSQVAGAISSAMDVGYMSVIIFAYLGRQSHKSRWVAYGGIIVTIACFIRVLPHVLYGAGQDAINLAYVNGSASRNSTIDIGHKDMSLCRAISSKGDCSEGSAVIPTAILMFSQLLLGIGLSSYWSLGVAYMDDNTRKDKVAVLVSAVGFIRMLGPTIGFVLAAFSLERYIDPSLTPSISTKDPRWVGAWWLAWIPLGIANLILSILMAFFPKTLPRQALRQNSESGSQPVQKPNTSLKDFTATVKRLLRNKLLVLNMLSTLSYMFGMVGYWIFLPKYMESQFQQSASRANLVAGSVGLVFTGLGLVSSGSLITLLKPRARYLAGWNIFVQTVDALGHYMFIFIGCPISNFHGNRNPDLSLNLISPCNADCGCTAEVKYDPVCDLETNTTFYSPCHAGCTSFSMINSSRVFTNCSCALSQTIADGTCPVDCSRDFLTFIILMSVLRFFSSTGRAGNSLIQFRCVSPADKALSIGLLELCLIVLSFTPGPIVYGILLDAVCIVWGKSCGSKGNCWLYDGKRLRFNLNIIASTFLLGAACFDVGVCYYAKDLKLYDDDTDTKKKKDEEDDSVEDNKTAEESEAELLVLRACQSPVVVKKSDISEED